jgi:S-adenosylmethionine synthetase
VSIKGNYLFTSESVSEGHPDKVCDQISDAVLDAILSKDPGARVACETFCTTGLVVVGGEITTKCYVPVNEIARDKIRDIGYTGKMGGGFDADTCAVMVTLDQQSADIGAGVDKALESRETEDKDANLGAGDQGIMFGFACNETADYMPISINLAHKLVKTLAEIRRHDNEIKYLRPDAKSQVTIEYVNGQAKRIDTIVISTQHDPEINGKNENHEIQQIIQNDLLEKVIKPVLAQSPVKADENTKYLINPSGRFVIGGPQGDAGLTGRKIIVDTYGGFARHGGGAFSGKDPTKVDRSAAYAARHAAKNIVATGIADRCEIQLSYAIGVATPTSINVETFGTASEITDEKIADIIAKVFDFRPQAIIKNFKLLEMPALNGGNFYQQVAKYGHFGRDEDGLDLPWERLDKVEALQAALQNQKQAV